MRCALVLPLAVATACASSTSPTHPAVDSISMNGSWTAADAVSDTFMLFLTQTGDSVDGTGSVAYVPVRVLGSNLSPQRCSPGCLLPIEVLLQLTDLANDTLVLGGHFTQDTDQVQITVSRKGGPAPGIPFVFASVDTMTITRASAHLAARVRATPAQPPPTRRGALHQ